ncbi:hypothetical protein R1flu_022278 [Riccia fluitans]|uniref:Uncharacterized protein n=1 Tax=Riccia fluitans TaxID=41844 RepID=A0ABD1ZRS1_9MARC
MTDATADIGRKRLKDLAPVTKIQWVSNTHLKVEGLPILTVPVFQQLRMQTQKRKEARKESVAKKEPMKRRRGSIKQKQVSLTMGQVGNDIALDVFKKLANFIWERADIGVIALERRDANLQLHVQGVLSIKSTSSRALKSDIASAIEWDENNPTSWQICSIS